MKRQLLFLIVAFLAGVAAICTSFCLWESYARPSFAGGWGGTQYRASGWEKGRWAWEEGPIAFDYKKEGTVLLPSLSAAYAEFATNDDMHAFGTVPEGRYSSVRIRPAVDEIGWEEEIARQLEQGVPSETLRPIYQAHKRFVYATRYHWIPLHWVPLALLVLCLSTTLPASRPLKRMKSLAGSLSLLLAIGLIVLWVRSYWREDTLELGDEAIRKSQSISATQGVIEITSEEIWGMVFVTNGWSAHSPTIYPARNVPPHSRFLGFGFEHFSHAFVDVGSKGWTTSFPIVLPLLLTLIQPALICRSLILLRCRRKNPTACINCGYDLRASPERCPECGERIVRAS